MDNVLRHIDQSRKNRGLLTVEEVLDLSARGNVVLDPWSLIVSASVEIGSGNTFYPNVIIECDDHSSVSIGNDNIFHSATLVIGADGGSIRVGNSNELGDGGMSIKANRSSSTICIGSNCRLIGGGQILGRTSIGDGCQIIGPITVQDSSLGGGDSYLATDPDNRGAVLKGQGLARGLDVARGQVINGSGAFLMEAIEPQSNYH